MHLKVFYLLQAAAEAGIQGPEGKPLNVGMIMEPWMLQPGYPLVTVELTEEGSIKAYQKQFFDKHFLQEFSNANQ